MRFLSTTRGSSGHVGPLAPFARALIDTGHDVLFTVAAVDGRQRGAAGAPGRADRRPGPRRRWMPLLGAVSELTVREAHELMVAEFFGRIDVEATLDGVRGVAAGVPARPHRARELGARGRDRGRGTGHPARARVGSGWPRWRSRPFG